MLINGELWFDTKEEARNAAETFQGPNVQRSIRFMIHKQKGKRGVWMWFVDIRYSKYKKDILGYWYLPL